MDLHVDLVAGWLQHDEYGLLMEVSQAREEVDTRLRLIWR